LSGEARESASEIGGTWVESGLPIRSITLLEEELNIVGHISHNPLSPPWDGIFPTDKNRGR